MTNAERKQAEAKRILAQNNRDAVKADAQAHSYSPKAYKIAGERDGTIRHHTLYQQKQRRGDASTNADPVKHLSIFARQIATNPSLFDNAFRVQGVANQHPRSTIPASEGRRAMSISASRHGTPSDSSKPVKLPAFVQAKLKESKRK
jgi:hypothetical protein